MIYRYKSYICMLIQYNAYEVLIFDWIWPTPSRKESSQFIKAILHNLNGKSIEEAECMVTVLKAI